MKKRVLAMIPTNGFRDRTAAGQALAPLLTHFSDREDVVVLALPRGGIPVGRVIAQALGAPLDVFMVRRVSLPEEPELVIGAIATGGVQLLNEGLLTSRKLSAAAIARAIERETHELKRREAVYRGGRPPLEITNRSVILVDDGVATGYTMRVAILALRQLNPTRLTVAIPVGAPETCRILEGLVDELICPLRPEPFHAVGLVYDHFPPVTDEEVREAIAHAAEIAKSPGGEELST